MPPEVSATVLHIRTSFFGLVSLMHTQTRTHRMSDVRSSPHYTRTLLLFLYLLGKRAVERHRERKFYKNKSCKR